MELVARPGLVREEVHAGLVMADVVILAEDLFCVADLRAEAGAVVAADVACCCDDSAWALAGKPLIPAMGSPAASVNTPAQPSV